MSSRITGNLTLAPGTVKNEHVLSTEEIDADKLQHIHHLGTNFDLAIGGTVAAREEIVYVAQGAGTIRGFHAKLNGAATTGTTTFECKKNGTTVLSSGVAITSSEGTNVQDGTLSVTSFVADDVISIQLSNSSGDGTGPYAWAVVEVEAES